MDIDTLFSKLLIIVIPLYFTQGWLFGSGSIVSQILIGIWLLGDFYYLFYYYKNFKNFSIPNAIFVFWIVNLLYWLFSPKVVGFMQLSFKTFGDFKNLTTVVFSFFPFVVLSYKQIMNDKNMRRFVVLFLAASVVAFMTKQNTIIAEHNTLITNNTAYYFAVILPFLGVFWGDKRLWAGFFVILVFLLLCAKRGAIICAIITLLFCFMLSMKNMSKHNILSRILGAAFISAIIIVVVINMYSSSELLQNRLLDTQEGDASNRDIIYAELWNIFLQSNELNQIFGHGMSQTVTLRGGYAHNDWLELLTDEGVFGVMLYAFVFLSFFSFYLKNKNNMKISYRFIYLAASSCFLFRSIFSMGYLAPENALFCAAIGYSQGCNFNCSIQKK